MNCVEGCMKWWRWQYGTNTIWSNLRYRELMFAFFTEFNAVFVIVAQDELFDFLHVTNCTHPAAMSVCRAQNWRADTKEDKEQCSSTWIYFIFFNCMKGISCKNRLLIIINSSSFVIKLHCDHKISQGPAEKNAISPSVSVSSLPVTQSEMQNIFGLKLTFLFWPVFHSSIYIFQPRSFHISNILWLQSHFKQFSTTSPPQSVTPPASYHQPGFRRQDSCSVLGKSHRSPDKAGIDLRPRAKESRRVEEMLKTWWRTLERWIKRALADNRRACAVFEGGSVSRCGQASSRPQRRFTRTRLTIANVWILIIKGTENTEVAHFVILFHRVKMCKGTVCNFLRKLACWWLHQKSRMHVNLKSLE